MPVFYPKAADGKVLEGSKVSIPPNAGLTIGNAVEADDAMVERVDGWFAAGKKVYYVDAEGNEVSPYVDAAREAVDYPPPPPPEPQPDYAMAIKKLSAALEVALGNNITAQEKTAAMANITAAKTAARL